MSKHKQRRDRRARYNEMLRAELNDEGAFIRRVIRTIDNGFDFAPDGGHINADFFRVIDDWKKTDEQSSRAGLSLIESAVRQIQIRPVYHR